MALFNSESKEDKKARKAQELLEKYGLQELSDARDLASVKSIAANLAGSNLISFGATLQGKTEDVAKMSLLQAIIDQNWIIIRQLDKLNQK